MTEGNAKERAESQVGFAMTKADFMAKIGLPADQFPKPGETLRVKDEKWSITDYFKHMMHMKVRGQVGYVSRSRDGKSVEVVAGDVVHEGANPILYLAAGDLLKHDLHGFAFEASVTDDVLTDFRPSTLTRLFNAPELGHLDISARRGNPAGLKSWGNDFYPAFTPGCDDQTAVKLTTQALAQFRDGKAYKFTP